MVKPMVVRNGLLAGEPAAPGPALAEPVVKAAVEIVMVQVLERVWESGMA